MLKIPINLITTFKSCTKCPQNSQSMPTISIHRPTVAQHSTVYAKHHHHSFSSLSGTQLLHTAV